jgi:hypothetical protein
MKTKAPKESNAKVYALLGVLAACSIGYFMWPTLSNSAESELMAALVRENTLLRGNLAAVQQAPAVRACVRAGVVQLPRRCLNT